MTTLMKKSICGKPRLEMDVATSTLPVEFCPGCHYGIILRLICEVIDELGVEGTTIGVTDVGCNPPLVGRVDVDRVMGLHGRSLVVATGIKRVRPDAVVYHAVGDGALGAIGSGHFLNAMIRSEKVTTVFINNAGYGMTGGQLAPTTLPGMRTTTTPEGREPRTTGFPFHAAELAATMKGTAYSARVSVHTPANFQKAKKALKTAFQKQIDNVGYGIVEFVSACPTDWGLNPVDSLKFVDEKMLVEFPLGEFKNVDRIDCSVDEDLRKIGRISR